MEEPDENRLVQKAIKGDSKAFSMIMKNYKTYLYRTAFAYVKDEEKALEILQECTYRGVLNIKKLKNPAYFKTWITRILINCSLTMLKNESKTVYFEENSLFRTETESLAIEQKLDLYHAIDLLRKNYKTVIILKYFNDLSISSIAQIMDIPENTVKTYLRRAKESLSKILREDYLHD